MQGLFDKLTLGMLIALSTDVATHENEKRPADVPHRGRVRLSELRLDHFSHVVAMA